jgi:hypothetical protein
MADRSNPNEALMCGCPGVENADAALMNALICEDGQGRVISVATDR